MAVRDYRAFVFFGTGAIVVALLAGFNLVERALNADLLQQLGHARGRIQGVVALRRNVRNTQLKLLERSMGSQAEKVEILAAVKETLAGLEAVEAPGITPPEDRALVDELETDLQQWAVLVMDSLDAPLDAGRIAELRQRLDAIDAVVATLVERSAASGTAVEATTRALDRRRRAMAIAEVVVIASTLWLAAWWWSQRERLRAEVQASEAARLRLRQMAAGVAHEINNQLGALNNTLELLRRKLPDDELIAFQKDSLEQMEKLTRDFQEFSAPQLRNTEQLDVVEVARHVASAFGGEVTVRAPGAPVLVETDRGRLSGALLNMVKNGLEAAPPVELDVEKARGGVRVRCTDHGPGISAEHEAQVGQPFFTTKARGTGLGVATVRQLAEAHGGTFTLVNGKAGGAVAELWLPKHPPRAARS